MDGDRIEKLLEEIRDLMQQLVNNSERAIANQTASIEKQRQAVEFYQLVVKRLVIFSIPLVLLIGFLVYWLFRSPIFP